MYSWPLSMDNPEAVGFAVEAVGIKYDVSLGLDVLDGATCPYDEGPGELVWCGAYGLLCCHAVAYEA